MTSPVPANVTASVSSQQEKCDKKVPLAAPKMEAREEAKASHVVEPSKPKAKKNFKKEKKLPINVTVNNVTNAAVPAKPATLNTNPTISTNVQFQMLESAVSFSAEQTAYLAESKWLPVIGTIGAHVGVMPYGFLPYYAGFTYNVVEMPLEGINYVWLSVVKRTYSFEECKTTYEYYINAMTVIDAMKRSTSRNFDVLCNSIVMGILRADQYPQLCSDAYAMCEAIATLILARNYENTTLYSAELRAFSDYVPTVEGWYAIGGRISPENDRPFGHVHWKTPRRPAAQDYVARCLDDDYAERIPPLYIPARTPAELLKGFKKRLTHPPRTFNCFAPNREIANQAIVKAVDWLIAEIDRWTAGCPPILPVDVLALCEEHAKERFTGQAQREEYMAGVRIALEEPVASRQFLKMVVGQTKVGCFVKGEGYEAPKELRLIMVPGIPQRGFLHALLMQSQMRIFGFGEHRNAHCVKHLNDEERAQYVREMFGNERVFNTDYSSMEGSVTVDMMNLIERKIFSHYASWDFKGKIEAVWDALTSRQYEVEGDDFSFRMDPMRLSGQEHTSAGNFLINFTWLVGAIYLITGQMPDPLANHFLFEGDDGLGNTHIKLQDGTYYDVQPNELREAVKTFGGDLKINIYNDVTEASFCGINLRPCMAFGQQGDMLFLDTQNTLSKLLWDVDYDRCTRKHDSGKLYAKCLSYLPRCVGNEELYAIVWHLASKHQPGNETVRTSWFKQVWLKTFYKGTTSDVPSISSWPLKRYAEEHNLPVLTSAEERDVPSHIYPEQRAGMSITYIAPPEDHTYLQCLAETVRTTINIASRNDPGWQIIENASDGKCMWHAVHRYLYETGQTSWDYSLFEMRKKQENRHLGNELSIQEAMDLLNPGQRIVVRSHPTFHQPFCTEYLKAEGSVITSTVAADEQRYVIDTYDGLFNKTGHSVVSMRETPAQRKYGDWRTNVSAAFAVIFGLMAIFGSLRAFALPAIGPIPAAVVLLGGYALLKGFRARVNFFPFISILAVWSATMFPKIFLSVILCLGISVFFFIQVAGDLITGISAAIGRVRLWHQHFQMTAARVISLCLDRHNLAGAGGALLASTLLNIVWFGLLIGACLLGLKIVGWVLLLIF